ncbi:substrate-binding and GGDEF domain-containing protein [Paractinoplanes atraurantiacus]|uniref:substrate-binding and GGDEF domain-containing protein n=1 Tax=Paractinoplanes atraurantiacus TaxID=1036182 RepID=UPI0015CF31F7|nr:GGDEF domain-containing protein [Actinoplanes atraurantiacus]
MTGRTFGVLSPFVGGDYYGAIIAGVNAAAVAAGDRIVAIQTLDPGSYSADRSGLPDFRRPVSWRHLNGLIVLPGALHASYAKGARRAGLPVVSVGQKLDECPAVLADNRSGIRDAVGHLLGHGHERIAYAGHLAHFDLRERLEGYREALLAHGIEPDPELVFDSGDNHESGGEMVADVLLRRGVPVSAVVCGTDRNAVGVIGRLASAGYRVPGDVAVVGFDDIVDATYMRPSLSTVRQPVEDVGTTAHRLVAQPDDSDISYVATTFVRRSSCGCPGIGLPVSEELTRSLFGEVRYLQETLNVQHELGIDLLGAHERDPRALAWLQRTTLTAGCLGLWNHAAVPARDTELSVVGEYPGRPGWAGERMRVSEFPPAGLFEHADGPAGEIVFVVPVRSGLRDWGVLAAIGKVQQSTPAGREIMNHSGALLATALDRGAMVAALREQEQKLRDAALHDALTGLPNRVLLADRLEQAGLRSQRRPDHRFAVLLLDLNGFKAVNDSLGHAAGDVLLIEVARRLTALLRESDTVARLGGDEFVVLLDGLREPGAERVVRDAIATRLCEPYLIDGEQIEVGVSIGVALSGDGSTDPDRLLREADAAMYRAKPVSRPR